MICVQAMTNEVLMAGLKANVRTERKGHGEFLLQLSEFDVRKLFVAEGFPSLFQYCTQELGLSEATTSKRIQVARTSRKFPLILKAIADGELNLTNAGLLSPHLTEENHEKLLDSARKKSKFEVEKLIASLRPVLEVKEAIRKLPALESAFAGERKIALFTTPPSRRDALKPVSATRTKFVFCADDEVLAMYRTLQSRLRHKHPGAGLEAVVREAFKALLKQTDPEREPERKVTARHLSKHTRYIPVTTRRAIWRRDRGQCGFQGPSGRLCGSRDFLEIDHIIPWSLGGSSQDPGNLTLRCRAHNQLKGGAQRTPRP